MKHSTLPATTVTIGMDVGDRFSYLYAIHPSGERISEERIRTTPDSIRKRFASIARVRVAIETGTHSPWISRLLEECGHEVMVANARELRFIYNNVNKTDAADAEGLARAARFDPKLLHPIKHRSQEQQADLAVLRARACLVEARTKLVQHVRGAMKSYGYRVRASWTATFTKVATEVLPEDLEPALLPVLGAIQELTNQIREHDRLIEKELCAKKYPVTKILQQVNGVGPITALAYALILGDPSRFEDSRSVGPYLGLTPRRSDSGDSSPQLRITKAGDVFMRRLLVGSAQYILGPFGLECDLKTYGEAIAKRGGKNAKRRAVVAVARKLAVLLHRLWITGDVYDPLRKQKQQRKSSQN